MATTGQTIVNKCEILLMDESNTHWSENELLEYLNEGMRAVVREKPDANPNTASALMASGFWQSLPSGSILLLDVTHNMGITPGSTRGTPVTIVERKWLDMAIPTWTTDTASATAKHIIYDPKSNPKKFMVYPQGNGAGYIELVTAVLPTAIAIGANIGLGDEYADILIDYIMFRALSKNADYVKSAERAMAHYNNFLMQLGKLEQVELLTRPKWGQGGK